MSDGGAGVSTHMAIEVRGLTKVFETGRRRRRVRVEAVRDISLGVEAGERIAYIGPNGAGKSTSIKMLTGILHPTAARPTSSASCRGASGARSLGRSARSSGSDRNSGWS